MIKDYYFKKNIRVKLLMYSLFILGFIGLLHFHTHVFGYVFDLIFLILAIGSSSTINKKTQPFFIISFIYILISYIYILLFNKSNVFDFLIIYKSIYYIAILSLLYKKKIIGSGNLKLIYNVLMTLFLIKYTYARVLGIDDRPFLFVESNFELVFLILVFYLRYLKLGSLKWYEYVTIILIFFLSGSRSGMAILLFVFFMIYIEDINFKKSMYWLILLPIVGFAVYYVFINRMGDGGIEQIDRYVMGVLFIEEISDWNLINYFFGTPPITELNYSTCKSLRHYQSLFSYSGEYKCYSVILHSFFYRVIYDHGILGLIFLVGSYYFFLRKAGYKKINVYTVLGVILLNSLSVSAFNSTYTILGIIMYISLDAEKLIKK